MSNELDIESYEMDKTNSNRASSVHDEEKSKFSLKKPSDILSHRKKDSDEAKKNELSSGQDRNNFSVKTGQPLCLKSLDKQEGIVQFNFLPSLNENKRGETNSDFGTNRIFMFNRNDDKHDCTIYDDIILSHYLKKLNKPQFLSFLLSPIQKKVWLRCRIKKVKVNQTTFFYCYLNDFNDDYLLMIATRTSKKSYTLQTNLNFNSPNMIQIGKMRKNFLGTQFSLNCLLPEYPCPKISINFCINLLGMAGPMGMKVTLPLAKGNETIQLRNKAPTYSDRFRCYVLDYIDRSVQCSSKNFQLVAKEDSAPNSNCVDRLGTEEKRKILLQFGEIEENCYLLDYKYPLSPMQAFAIGISNLHNKMMCE